MLRLWYFAASLRKLVKASCLLAWASDLLTVCKKVVAEDSNVDCASGEVRISIALVIPVNSSVRKRDLSDHSAALSLQPCLVSSKNFSSASTWAMVSSRETFESASSLVL